jgi:methyl coenzyme M reductase beta subunit
MACAYLFLDIRKEKITMMADKLNIEPIKAATIYTIGAIKASLRRGTAENYKAALDALENEQVGDRGRQIIRTINADIIANTVARISTINAGSKTIPDYYKSVDNGNTWEAHYPDSRKKPKSSTKAAIRKIIDRVRGTLAVAWEDMQAELDPARVLDKSNLDAKIIQIEKYLMLIFAEYESRLSRMSKKRLYALAQGTEPASYLTSRMGQNDPKTKKQAWAAVYLFQNFPYKDCLKCVDFINLVRRYVKPK